MGDLETIRVRCSMCGKTSEARARIDAVIVPPNGWLVVCDPDARD